MGVLLGLHAERHNNGKHQDHGHDVKATHHQSSCSRVDLGYTPIGEQAPCPRSAREISSGSANVKATGACVAAKWPNRSCLISGVWPRKLSWQPGKWTRKDRWHADMNGTRSRRRGHPKLARASR